MTEERIDTRDLVDELAGLNLEPDVPEDYEVQPIDTDDDEAEDIATCGTCGLSWDDGKVTGITPAPSARCPFEPFHADHEDQERCDAIRALFEEISGYAGDEPEDGIFLIREDSFEDYARELADDIGAIDADAGWPNSCIDWAKAADELAMDYTTVDFDGATYYYR